MKLCLIQSISILSAKETRIISPFDLTSHPIWTFNGLHEIYYTSYKAFILSHIIVSGDKYYKNMTYTDPLIKELKGYILAITEELQEKEQITDNSGHIVPLCDAIERIFQKGSVVHGWNALEEIAHLMNLGHLGQKSFSYLRAVEMVRSCQKVKTPVGKLRLLIRSCLANKCLNVPVEIMVRSHNNLIWNWYELETSILGNEILGEIFLSVVLQCSTMCFKLELNNSRFLDITHVLPHCRCMEFVPSNELGVSISFIDNKALVVHVDGKSVAAEDDQIQVGDILDELNGQVLHSELKGRVSTIITKGKNKPILVKVIKARDPETGCLFPPIELLMKKANVCADKSKNCCLIKSTGGENLSSRNKRRNVVNYVGSVQVGESGHIKMIEHAILSLIKDDDDDDDDDNRILTKVEIQCHELGLKVIKESTGEIVTCNSFMEISSCGQTKKHPDHFGYIAGNNLCNLASKFTCHVFQSDHDSDIHSILQSIGEGFHRTHFAV